MLSRAAALAIAGTGLLVSVLATGRVIEQAVHSAACLERARYELILCAGPPEPTAWLLAVICTLAFAIGLGMAIGTPRQLVAARDLLQR